MSSKSWAWPAVPLARAAQVGAARSEVPTIVQSGVPPSARMTPRTAAAAGSDAPASITPSVSSVARRTWAIGGLGSIGQRGLDDELGETGGRAHGRTIAEGLRGCKAAGAA